MIGNINQYVKIMEYEKKAYERIENCKSSFEEATGVSLPKTNKKSIKAQVAASKLASGKKLNYVDLDALRREDPAAYERAMAVMRERKSYERRLKQCRSKSEARSLQLSKACSFAGDVKSGNANAPSACGTGPSAAAPAPNASGGGMNSSMSGGESGQSSQGGTTFPHVLERSKACEDVFIQYTKTRDYRRLPLFGVKRLKNVKA